MTDPGKIFDGMLVLQYRSGNKKALNLLVKKYHTKLCKHSYWYTHDLDASNDVVQDCWSKMIYKLDSLKDPNLFGSWAFRIVTRKSLDYAKKRKRELNKLGEHQSSEFHSNQEEDKKEEIGKLRKAMKNLSKEKQMVLQLFYMENYSLKEISEILQISVGTVKSRLFHARERLKIILKK